MSGRGLDYFCIEANGRTQILAREYVDSWMCETGQQTSGGCVCVECCSWPVGQVGPNCSRPVQLQTT